MGKVFFSKHAKERALERYGMDLTTQEMWDIFKACRDGKALCGHRSHRGDVYMMRVRGQVIIPVLSPAKDIVITFMPPHFFTSGSSLKHYQKNGAKQRSTSARNARMVGYRRERITVQQALEAE